MRRFLCLLSIIWAVQAFASSAYWHINHQGGITWTNDGRPHTDHIEMSGKRVSVVLRYGITSAGTFTCNFGMVWPMLRTVPNDTHASLMRRLQWNALDNVTVNQRSLHGEHVDSITLDGTLTVYSHFGKTAVKRVIAPSTDLPAVVEQITITNGGRRSLKMTVDNSVRRIVTDKNDDVNGPYIIEQVVQPAGIKTLSPDKNLNVCSVIYGRRSGESLPSVDIVQEISKRRALVGQLQDQLVLETPDPVINRMMAFAKVRVCESIYETKAGPMHGPGGESYYAAIWANDQAEYANPFFPFIGYQYANESAMVSWKLFERWQPKGWSPIPSSIIAEGDDIWNGAGDRGDAAMIAYGAGRYALEMGSAKTAEELWPLITWCLEYCERQLNDKGVVQSDHDELEGRFPAGSANLCTSSLYYDALISAAYLSRDLKAGTEKKYLQRAEALRKAIDRYFHADMQGFDTYRYYEGNTLLRSWICVPLAMGIHDHAKGTLDALFSPMLWTENGLLTQQGDMTYWDRSTLYALRGALQAGETERAMNFLEKYSKTRLLGSHVPYAIEAWPEGDQRHLSAESALYARIFTEGLFGLRATGLRSFSITPRLPMKWAIMILRNVHLCGEVFDFTVERKNRQTIVKIKQNGKTTSRIFSGKPINYKI